MKFFVANDHLCGGKEYSPVRHFLQSIHAICMDGPASCKGVKRDNLLANYPYNNSPRCR